MPKATPIQFKLSDFVGHNPPLAQLEFIEAAEPEVCWVGGFGCVAAETLIEGVPVGEWTGGSVWSLNGRAWASPASAEGQAALYRVTTQSGRQVVVTLAHRFSTPSGWRPLSTLRVGDAIAVGGTSRGGTDWETGSGSLERCWTGSRPRGEWPTPWKEAFQDRWPLSHMIGDESSARPLSSSAVCVHDGTGEAWQPHLSTESFAAQMHPVVCELLPYESTDAGLPQQAWWHRQEGILPQVPSTLDLPGTGVRGQHQEDGAWGEHSSSTFSIADPSGGLPFGVRSWYEVITDARYVKFGDFYDLTVPGPASYLANGIWHHNCGKTVGLSAKFIMTMLRYPGSRLMICRQTYDELIKTTKQTFFRVAQPLKDAGLIERPRAWEYTEQTNYVRLTTGAELTFSNLEDISKFKNIEVTGIGIDQTEENEYEIFQMLKRRIRPTFRQKEVPPSARQMCLIANDEGRNWLWDRYHPDSIGTMNSRHFIHSTSFDNPHLDETYLKDLLTMSPDWVNKYVYARMDSKTGRLLPDPIIIPPCYPPDEVDVFLAVDHGESTVCSAHWGFENTTENVIPPGIPPGGTCIFKEYWSEGSTVEEHARNLIAMCHRLKVVSRVMDHTTFRLTQSRRGGIRNSIADLYRDCGLTLTPSVGNPDTRVERINVVQGRGLYVTKDCPNYIRQAPHYHTKVNRRTGLPEIVNKSSYHAVDSVGYLLMSMPNLGPRIISAPGEGELPPWLQVDHVYWQRARDEASRQFAINNYRETVQTTPFGGDWGADSEWEQTDL